MSADSMTRLGMVGWLVRDQTVSAVIDMPGVLAISLRGGACLLGEAASVLRALWEPEQSALHRRTPCADPQRQPHQRCALRSGLFEAPASGVERLLI
jgi:hypothetical protein